MKCVLIMEPPDDLTPLMYQQLHMLKVKVKQSRYRPGVAQRVPGS